MGHAGLEKDKILAGENFSVSLMVYVIDLIYLFSPARSSGLRELFFNIIIDN